MAGILGIDLDSHELRLVELHQSSAGQQLHAALVLPLTSASAADMGLQLKAKLKEVGFKATTAAIALGHDAFMCRDIRHPDIPANELPAIVQFQAMKECALPADDSIVDYVPISGTLASGEKRSLTFVVRKGRVKFCQDMCEAAGLKLLAVVPRPMALLAGLPKGNLEGTDTTGYACSNSFFVLHHGSMIFSRSMGAPNDVDDFIGELRRSIAGYENQANVPVLTKVMLAGHELPADVEQHLGSFHIPMELYSPYMGIAGAERLSGHGDYAVASGAAQLKKAFKTVPVEFLEPKKVVVKPNRSRSYLLVGGVAAAAVALLVYGLYWMLTSSADSEIASIKERIQLMQQKEKEFADVDKRFEAIKAWKDHELYILEEIYNLVEVFPDVAGVQITKAEWRTITPSTAPGLGGAGAASAANTPSKFTASKVTSTAPVAAASLKTQPIKPVAKLTVKATAENEQQLKSLETALRDSRYWKWVKSDLVTQEANTRIYELDVLPLKPEDYRSVIAIGSNVTAPEGAQTNRPGTRRGFRPTGGGR